LLIARLRPISISASRNDSNRGASDEAENTLLLN